MATVVTVHGTFAHVEAPKSADGTQAPVELQWWQQGSTFEHDMREMLDATPGAGSGKVEVERFEWSGNNSEEERRKAGAELYRRLKAIDAKGEPYCVIGHSHGGSVLGWALLESAERRDPLDNLKRWVTVGTPFVSMEKQRLLFARLGLAQKVVFVASAMLLVMFLVYILTQTLTGGRVLFGNTFPAVLVVTGVMMSLPIVVFYGVLKYFDAQKLLHFRHSVKRRANAAFAPRWLSLTHRDDEAVQGLAFLPGAQLYFFDKAFAVSAITMLSVVAVPLLYLMLLTSPTLMVGVADWLKTHVYETKPHVEAEQALRNLRVKMRDMRGKEQAGKAAPGEEATFWKQYRAERTALAAKYPDINAAERALRFEGRFFEVRGVPCLGRQLCGGGRDLTINSGLLLHIVTDELSSALGGDGREVFRTRTLMSLLLPAVLVPVIFGLLSLLLMVIIRGIATLVSDGASQVLNRITNAEVKRAAFGNDTEGERAIGAVDRPDWIEQSPPRLPDGIGSFVTDYSNGVASNSLAKFRNAIGQLASAEPKHTAESAITTYFTWKELVHASYFDVGQFRKLVARGLCHSGAFSPSAGFRADPAFANCGQWLAEIEGTPGRTEIPGDQPPTQEDAGAVSAVVASTVKATP